MRGDIWVCVAGLLLAPVIVSGFLPAVAVAEVGSVAAAAQTRSVWSGVYRREQADAGEKVFFARCSSCHGDDLGGREQAPALAGTTFLEAWHGKDLLRLLDRITTMPPGDPVSSAQALDLLAFLLRSSEMPGGSTPLPTDRFGLTQIMFERAKP